MLRHGLNSRSSIIRHLHNVSTVPKLVRCESTYSAIHRGLRRSEGSDRPSGGRATEFSERRSGSNRRDSFAPRRFDTDRSGRGPRDFGERSKPERSDNFGWGSEESGGRRGDENFGARDSSSRPVKVSRKSERRPWDARGPQKPLGRDRDNESWSTDFETEELPAQSSRSTTRDFASELQNDYEIREKRKHSYADARGKEREQGGLRSRRSFDEPSRDFRERRRPNGADLAALYRADADYTFMPNREDSERPAKTSRYESANQGRLPREGQLITHYTEQNVRHTLPAWVRIPYTTAASQFIYGHSAVQAALKARRRKLYRLYVYDRLLGSDNEGGRGSERLQALKKLALAGDIKVKEVDDRFVPMMDKLSEGRPHNGCLLEASPLPNPLIEGLQKVDAQADSFEVIPSTGQSEEDLEINGTMTKYPFSNGGWRHPFLLYLDGITDTGNMGAILRSAYILGVDGIVMEPRNNASMNSTALKTSSGAAEAIQIFKIPSGSSRMEFFKKSRENGWRIYAAHMPPEPRTPGSPSIIFKKSKAASRDTSSARSDKSPLSEAPAVLILGNEETGVTRELLRLADYHVGVGLGRAGTNIGLDSLNVSVAASLLSMNFLQKPSDLGKKEPEGQKDDVDQDLGEKDGKDQENDANQLF